MGQGDKKFAKIKKRYGYFAVHEFSLNFPLEDTHGSARRLAHKSLLLEENNNQCGRYSVAAVWTDNNVFTFDSHSRNTDGLHDPNGWGVLLSFATASSLSDNVK